MRLTDKDGLVTAWDNYSADGTDIQLLEAVRRLEHGREHVTFTPEEIKMLHQFKYGGRKGTISMLTDILPVIKDRQTREIVENTVEKIGRLTEDDFKNLAEATKNGSRLKWNGQSGQEEMIQGIRDRNGKNCIFHI